MKEGRAKLEESAIIVQEVAKELKVKDENIEKVTERLFQTLFVADGQIQERETLSNDILKLADVSQLCQMLTELLICFVGRLCKSDCAEP